MHSPKVQYPDFEVPFICYEENMLCTATSVALNIHILLKSWSFSDRSIHNFQAIGSSAPHKSDGNYICKVNLSFSVFENGK